jgi:hypothetical protein
MKDVTLLPIELRADLRLAFEQAFGAP